MQTTPALGNDIWAYFTNHPDEQHGFTQTLETMTDGISQALAQRLEIGRAETVADIGGASGALLVPLLLRHPNLRGLVVDRPGVVETVVATARDSGLSDRLKPIASDFFETGPAADLYLLKHILHDWDDAACLRILRAIVGGMPRTGRVVVIEMSLDDEASAGSVTLVDLAMLVMTGERTRTIDEYNDLFEAAGLRLTRVQPIAPPYMALTATAA